MALSYIADRNQNVTATLEISSAFSLNQIHISLMTTSPIPGIYPREMKTYTKTMYLHVNGRFIHNYRKLFFLFETEYGSFSQAGV